MKKFDLSRLTSLATGGGEGTKRATRISLGVDLLLTVGLGVVVWLRWLPLSDPLFYSFQGLAGLGVVLVALAFLFTTKMGQWGEVGPVALVEAVAQGIRVLAGYGLMGYVVFWQLWQGDSNIGMKVGFTVLLVACAVAWTVTFAFTGFRALFGKLKFVRKLKFFKGTKAAKAGKIAGKGRKARGQGGGRFAKLSELSGHASTVLAGLRDSSRSPDRGSRRGREASSDEYEEGYDEPRDGGRRPRRSRREGRRPQERPPGRGDRQQGRGRRRADPDPEDWEDEQSSGGDFEYAGGGGRDRDRDRDRHSRRFQSLSDSDSDGSFHSMDEGVNHERYGRKSWDLERGARNGSQRQFARYDGSS